MRHLCPNCQLSDMSIFHEIRQVPVHSVINIPSREAAIHFPKGHIALGVCHKCGFISNVAFDAGLLKYSTDCEESQGFSETYNKFAKKLAAELIDKYELREKKILEIGCGKGEFLDLLCTLGNNEGVGFDPAYVPGRAGEASSANLTFIQDFYSEKYAHYRADFVCCKMTLEHIHRTNDFVSMVRRAIGEDLDTVVFFQVPDVVRILKECAFEDIYYEHCSYFSPGSLSYLFHSCGFEPIELKSEYGEQYLVIVAKPVDQKSANPAIETEDLGKIESYVERFEAVYNDAIDFWQKALAIKAKKNQRTVIWGSGSKGVAFLTAVSPQSDEAIEYVVDINPFRQGHYMPGTGQEIVPPEFLAKYRPDTVIIMNSLYRNEIEAALSEMGVSPEIMIFGKGGKLDG